MADLIESTLSLIQILCFNNYIQTEIQHDILFKNSEEVVTALGDIAHNILCF